MADHPDVARGFVKGDKVLQEELWEELAAQLNAAGPPSKDVATWKKAWLDWKGNIRKKLAHNKTEVKKTGGGSYNQFVLTRTEEELAVICGIYKVIDGIENAKSFGVPKSKEIVDVDTIISSSPPQEFCSPQTHSKHQRPASSMHLSRNRNRENSLEDLLKKENKSMEKIGLEIANLNDNKKKICDCLQNIERKVQVLCAKIDNLGLKYDEIILIKREKLEEIKKQGIQQREHYNQLEKLWKRN